MSNIDQKEYLKKYVNLGDHDKRRKKKRKPPGRGTKILDDDVDVRNMPIDDGYEEKGEYAPQVVGVIDERPEDVRMKEDFDSSRWKALKHDEGKRRHDSPPRRQRHGSDQSPQRQRHDSDQSPQRHNSPPRRQRPDADQSPRRQRHDSDQSPRRHDSDQSPPRSRQRHDSDQSPPRGSKRPKDHRHTPSKHRTGPPRQRPDSDLSPKRLKQSMDVSPHESSKKQRNEAPGTRRPNRWGTPLSDREGEYSRKIQNGKPSSTLDGKKAGLQHAQALREENKHMRQKEKEYFDTIDSSVSGKGAKTVVRQEKQREMEAKRRKKEQDDRRQAEIDEKYSYWSKGLKQNSDHRARIEQDVHEMNKPLARYAGDHDLEEHLKNKDRDGDPMLAMVHKKRGKHSARKKQRPIYEGDYPSNRYKIRPGYRWDGVDRSNGFEKDLFTRKSNKKALEEDAYKWSVEDM